MQSIMSSTVTHGLPFAIIDTAIISITGLVSTLAVVLWIVIIVLRHISKKHKSSNNSEDGYVFTKDSNGLSNVNVGTEAITKMDRWFNIEKNMHLFVRYIIPTFKGAESADGKIKTILLDYVVPSIYIEQLLLFSFVVLACSLQVFISSFLFLKSYGCSTEYYVHCYAARVHFLIIEDRQLDCSNSTAIENITAIICYDVTLNVTRGISDAGAILAGAALYFVIITWILLKLLSKSCCGCCIVLTQVLITTIAGMVVLARLVALALDGDTTYEDFVYIIINIYVVLLGGAIPWWKFKPHHSGSTIDL